MKNKNGFTLIELLAVIIILGILMIIAIPSVTKYISDSRKNAYVDTAKEIISGARNMVNDGKLEMYATDTTYYIPTSCIKTENASKSPYGDFTKAYIGVIYDGSGYKYYWISVDDAGQGVNSITPLDKLDTDSIKSDLKDSDIENVVTSTGIGERTEIKILNCNTSTNIKSWDGQYHLDDISNNVPEESGGGGNNSSIIIYPTGKTKSTVENGDIVKLDTEEFYVIGRDGNNLVLITKYVLDISDDPNASTTGIQKSTLNGGASNRGGVKYSNEAYWENNVGEGKRYPGIICTEYSQYEGCAYVYDENSNVKQYVDSYKNYLVNLGMTIKEARLLNRKEIYNIRNGENWDLIVGNMYFWTGAPYLNSNMISLCSAGAMITSYDTKYGVRPVIVI